MAEVSPLFAQLHRWRTQDFEWGVCDCCLVLADWLWQLRGQDPAAHIRNLYDGPLSCERLTGFIRTPVAAIEACAETIGGLPRVDVPEPGDIGVLAIQGERYPFGALWTGTHWAGKGPGLSVTCLAPALVQPLAVWGTGYA